MNKIKIYGITGKLLMLLAAVTSILLSAGLLFGIKRAEQPVTLFYR